MAITDSTNPQAVASSTPAKGDTTATPNTNDLDLSLDLPPVVQETTPDTDRLKEEDKLTQNNVPPLLKEGDHEVVEDLKTKAKAKIIQANLPESSAKNPLQSSLKDDMNMIKNIENTATINAQPAERILETKNPAPMVEAQPSTINPQQTQPSTINIDSLLGDTQPTVAPIEQAKTPFDLVQANTPVEQVAQPAVITAAVATQPTIAIDKKKGVKIGLFVVLFVALGFLTYFIISTMYPMGFSTNTPSEEVIVAEITGDILTGEIIDTGAELVAVDTTGTIDTGHASADDAFQDINDLMTEGTTTNTTTLSQDAVVVKLNNYQEAGTTYLAVSKAENDLQSMKYALYLKNKSQTVLNEIIANPTAITTMQSDLTTQLAQFETFLLKLQAKYGDLTQTTTTATAVTQTPVTEIPVTQTPVTETPVTQTPVTNPTGAVIAE